MAVVDYQKRRKQGLRGQGDPIKPKIYPKGDIVKFTNSKGEVKELPNAEGSHLVRVKGGFRKVGRSESRRKSKMRAATTSNYAYQADKMGFKHDVNPPKQAERGPTDNLPNHVRHRARQIARQQLSKEK